MASSPEPPTAALAAAPAAVAAAATRALYAGPLMQHARAPTRRGRIPNPTHEATGTNRPCGDRLTLTLDVNGDHIRAARFDGEGCALSMATASLVCDHLEGQPLAIALALGTDIEAALAPESQAPVPALLTPLAAARTVPSRHACVRLTAEVLTRALRPAAG